MNYIVFVGDNYHFYDDDSRYKQGEYASYEEAKVVCEEIVDDFLQENYKPGMKPDNLFGKYKFFGDDPYIVPDENETIFSARNHADIRCTEIDRNG